MSPFGNSQNYHSYELARIVFSTFFNAIPAHLPLQGAWPWDVRQPTNSIALLWTHQKPHRVRRATHCNRSCTRARALALACVRDCLSLSLCVCVCVCVCGQLSKDEKNRRFDFFSPSSTTLRTRPVFPSCSEGQLIDRCSLALFSCL
jgi:hypothetical protein